MKCSAIIAVVGKIIAYETCGIHKILIRIRHWYVCIHLNISHAKYLFYDSENVTCSPGDISRTVANPDQYFMYTASFICHNFAYNCNNCFAFHLSIILIACQIYWNDSSIRQDKQISLI